MQGTPETRVRSLGWEDPLEEEMQHTPVFLPGKFHGQRNLVGYSPWGCKEHGSTWHPHFKLLLQEEGPLPVPKSGLLSNIWKWIVWGDTHADRARDFIGKGRPGGDQQDRGTQENCSATWLTASGFMLMGLVSGLSLAKSLFWLSVLPHGADIAQPRWMPSRRILGGGRTRGLLLTFPKLFQLVVAC